VRYDRWQAADHAVSVVRRRRGRGDEFLRFGVQGRTWQIVPTVLPGLLRDKDAGKANAVMQAMLQMGKLDIARLQQAYDRHGR
jgi:hypothetical protein